MTRTTRKLVAFMLGVAFVLFAFGTLAWATSGFRNWNAATWFNSWGKGTPTSAYQDSGAIEQSVSNSSLPLRVNTQTQHNDIFHDSDETSSSVVYSRFVSPQISIDEESGGLKIFGGYFMDYKFNVEFHGVWNSLLYSGEFTYNDDRIYIFSYDFIVDEVCKSLLEKDKDCVVHCVAYNSASDEHSASESVEFSFYVPIVNRADFGVVNSELGFTIPVFANEGSVPGYGDSGIYIFSEATYDFVLTEYNSASELIDTFEYVPRLLDGGKINYGDISFVSGISGSFISIDLLEMEAISHIGSFFEFAFMPKIATGSSLGISTSSDFLPCVMPIVLKYSFSISKLSAPENIRIENTMLKWNEVVGANGYAVFFGDTSTHTNEPELDISSYAGGTYTVRVRALGNVGVSLAKTGKATAFNASSVITQVVALTYDIDGDTVTKFVPFGKSVGDYLYDVAVDGREFGGWYYDSGFSSAVNSQDKLENDTIIYARLSDKLVTERPLTWWERNMWYVLAPCIAVGGILLIAGVALGIKKKKS